MQSTYLLTIELWETEAAVTNMRNYNRRLTRLIDAALLHHPGLHYRLCGTHLYVFAQPSPSDRHHQTHIISMLEGIVGDLSPYLVSDGYLWRAVITRGSVVPSRRGNKPPQGSAAAQAHRQLPLVSVVGLYLAPEPDQGSTPHDLVNARTYTDLPEGWTMRDYNDAMTMLEHCLGNGAQPVPQELDEEAYWGNLNDGLIRLYRILQLPADGPMPHQQQGYHGQTRSMVQQHFPALTARLGTDDPDPHAFSPWFDFELDMAVRRSPDLSQLERTAPIPF